MNRTSLLYFSVFAVTIATALALLILAYHEPRNGLLITVEMISIENITFVGTSGEESNSIILYLYNAHTNIDVILEQANVTGPDVNKLFSIAPEERSFPSESYGRVILFNVGWTKNDEYRISLYSSKGNRFSIEIAA